MMNDSALNELSINYRIEQLDVIDSLIGLDKLQEANSLSLFLLNRYKNDDNFSKAIERRLHKINNDANIINEYINEEILSKKSDSFYESRYINNKHIVEFKIKQLDIVDKLIAKSNFDGALYLCNELNDRYDADIKFNEAILLRINRIEKASKYNKNIENDVILIKDIKSNVIIKNYEKEERSGEQCFSKNENIEILSICPVCNYDGNGNKISECPQCGVIITKYLALKRKKEAEENDFLSDLKLEKNVEINEKQVEIFHNEQKIPNKKYNLNYFHLAIFGFIAYVLFGIFSIYGYSWSTTNPFTYCREHNLYKSGKCDDVWEKIKYWKEVQD